MAQHSLDGIRRHIKHRTKLILKHRKIKGKYKKDCIRIMILDRPLPVISSKPRPHLVKVTRRKPLERRAGH